jgi:two-component sensor histidine kinase
MLPSSNSAIIIGRHGEDLEVRRQLQEASNRVLAIARAHESLYKNDDIGMLDIGDYLRDLCRELNLSASGCTVEPAICRPLMRIV